MSDIVKLLRAEQDAGWHGQLAQTLKDAADEIERLRGIVAGQLESIQNLGTAPHCPTCACAADQQGAAQESKP